MPLYISRISTSFDAIDRSNFLIDTVNSRNPNLIGLVEFAWVHGFSLMKSVGLSHGQAVKQMGYPVDHLRQRWKLKLQNFLKTKHYRKCYQQPISNPPSIDCLRAGWGWVYTLNLNRLFPEIPVSIFDLRWGMISFPKDSTCVSHKGSWINKFNFNQSLALKQIFMAHLTTNQELSQVLWPVGLGIFDLQTKHW